MAARTKTFYIKPLKIFSHKDSVYVHACLARAPGKPYREPEFNPLLAIHRIKKVELTDRLFEFPKNYDFEKLIARSVFTNTPIMFTLEDGKIYVGWTNAAPNPVHARRSVRFLPLMSGYRDSKTHKVTFVTDYYEIFNKISSPECSELNHLSAEDFEVVVPVDRICSSHLFDLVVFNHFESKAAK